MRRHYYDSIRFPFLSDLLFDQLVNFDWEASRKEIERGKKDLSRLEKFCKNEDKHCKYLQTEDTLNDDIYVYAPEFKLKDGVYTYKTNIGKEVKPEDITIDAGAGYLFLKYESKSEGSSFSAASSESMPEDLDVDSMKAVFKNGVLTITAKQVEKKKEVKKECDDDVEYEIEIGK